MSVVNGQVANQTTFNTAFMSRTASSTSTAAIVSLVNTALASGASVSNLQALLNKLIEGVGTTGETDTAINTYASTHYVTNGSSRKGAIELLDTQLYATQTSLTSTIADVTAAQAAIVTLQNAITTINTLASTFAGDKTFSNNVIVNGNFTVNGTTTTVNSATIDSVDPNITVNKNGNNATSEGAGFTVDRTGTKGSFIYANALASRFKIGDLASEAEVVTVSHTQTLTNKTMTSPTLNTPTVDVVTGAQQGATPSTPASGFRKIYAKADGWYMLDSAGVETKIGSGTGSGGAVNLITNGSADDANASIFVPYADTGARAIDGTGGSPTVTTSLTSTLPLAGIKSFLLTKGAGSKQGEGWAIPFTVDPAYRAKVLTIDIDYIVNSGTFVAGSPTTDSDVVWTLYDVTNSQIIEPSSIKLLSNSSTISDKFRSTFQTSATGSSYRLIAHVATTSTAAYELKVEVAVSPSNYVYGTPITDWVAYTPTFTGGTYTNEGTFWRRVGDSIEIKSTFTTTTPAGTDFSMSLPAGLSIDPSKTNSAAANSNSHGSMWQFTAGAAYPAASGGPYAMFSDTAVSSTVVYASVASSGARFGKAAGTSVTGSGSRARIEIHDLPILGWSSSVQMSSDVGDTRLVLAKYRYSTAKTSSTAAPLNFDTLVSDTIGAVTTGASWRFTAQSAGKYCVQVSNTASGTSVTTQLYKNGSLAENLYTSPFTAGNGTINGSTEIDLVAGDFIDVRFDSSTTSSAGYVIITKVVGPNAIAASESLNLRYTSTAGTSIGTSDTSVPLVTKDYDTHGAFNGTTFTAPTSGKYNIAITLSTASLVLGTTQGANIKLFKNGAFYSLLSQVIGSGGTATYVLNGQDDVNLLSGDTLSIFMVSNVATSLSTGAGNCHMTIRKVG